MSELYDSIPKDRRNSYLANAEQAVDDATNSLLKRAIHDLGHIVVADAAEMTKNHAAAIEQAYRDADALATFPEIGNEAEAYAYEHDMMARIRKELDSPDAPDCFNIMAAVDSLKTNRSRGDINPNGKRDFNLNTGLGRAMENGAVDVAQNPADLMITNKPRPDLPGDTFFASLNKIDPNSAGLE